jgi:hypothetical protein
MNLTPKQGQWGFELDEAKSFWNSLQRKILGESLKIQFKPVRFALGALFRNYILAAAKFPPIIMQTMNPVWKFLVHHSKKNPVREDIFGVEKIQVLDNTFPRVLKGECLPINAVVVTSLEGAFALKLAIKGIRVGLGKSLLNIYLVVPDHEIGQFSSFESVDVKVIGDSVVLSQEILQRIRKIVPSDRVGWTVQQVIKLGFLYSNVINEDSILVVDADTILLNQNNWLDLKRRQALSISEEYHRPYQWHLERFLRLEEAQLNKFRLPFSFVTHHGVFQKHLISDLLRISRNDEFEQGILQWLDAIRPESDGKSFCAEWHSYATYNIVQNPKHFRIKGWRNIPLPLAYLKQVFGDNMNEIEIEQLQEYFPNANSISLHWYLDYAQSVNGIG